MWSKLGDWAVKHPDKAAPLALGIGRMLTGNSARRPLQQQGVGPYQLAAPTVQQTNANGYRGFAGGGVTNLLRGPGDGMSDSIPGMITGGGIRSVEPIRVADGEYVVSADVVSGLGNGSTDAGARRLDQMMADVRKSRTGTKKQAPAINPSKHLPK